MLYSILADIVVLIHTLWTLFLVIGAWWGLRRGWVRIVHIIGLIYAGATVPFDAPCPLSTIGLWLRTRHGARTDYTGHFIGYYAEKLVHIQLPYRFIEISTILLCLFNFWLYFGKGAGRLRRFLGGGHRHYDRP